MCSFISPSLARSDSGHATGDAWAWLTRTIKQTEVDTSHNLMVLSLDPDIRKGPGAGPPFLD